MDGACGVILCGGKSRRMGRDKALLALSAQDPAQGQAAASDQTLLGRTIGVLEPLARELWLACGSEPRYGEFQRTTGSPGIEQALDVFEGAGPLGGLHAGLVRARTEWVMLAACDLPRLETGLYRALLERAREAQWDVCSLQTEGTEGPREQPSIAVLRRTVLESVAKALGDGRRRLDAFHRGATAEGRPLRVGTLGEDQLPAGLRGRELARNLNTADDLARERVQLQHKRREVAG